MKHSLIILISFLILSFFLTSCDKKNGHGTKTYEDGSSYVGEWKNGKWNGQGTFTSSERSKSVGEWKDGELNGQGKYTWTDGRKYEGEWKKGGRNGQGTFTLPNGNKYIGEWKKGKPLNGTGYDKDGKILYKIVNGEPIK